MKEKCRAKGGNHSRLCYPSDYVKLGQEMVPLLTGNELMTQIRRGNDSGNQNKFKHKQQQKKKVKNSRSSKIYISSHLLTLT